MSHIQIPLNLSVPPKARQRLSRQCLEILGRLQEGPVHNTELARIAIRYSARIGELRAAGHHIQKRCLSEEKGIYEYWLVKEPL